MPMTWFRCPDGNLVSVEDCLGEPGCRLGQRCLTQPTLQFIARERKWTGIPSTTQLLNGTMLEFLKITQPYAVDPQNRAFALLGSIHHDRLEVEAKELKLPSEIGLGPDGKDIFDLIEPEDGSWTLTDYKTWGSYRVARAMGVVDTGKVPDPSGAKYKSSGKWGKAGSPKMVTQFGVDPSTIDMFESELQLNNYRIMLEGKGLEIGRMQLQVTVRDGGLAVANSRGIGRNIYLLPVNRLEDGVVRDFFHSKTMSLLEALDRWKKDPTYLPEPCDVRECWDGNRCRGYCEVAHFCPKGQLYKEAP